MLLTVRTYRYQLVHIYIYLMASFCIVAKIIHEFQNYGPFCAVILNDLLQGCLTGGPRTDFVALCECLASNFGLRKIAL